MQGRNKTFGDYRFGMNGQEKDDEITGNAGSHTSAEYWEYDTRLGRRWNTDPVIKMSESPFACFSDNPIYYADPLGSNTVTPADKGGGKSALKGNTSNTTGKWETVNKNNKFTGKEAGAFDLDGVTVTAQDNTSVASPAAPNLNVKPISGPPTFMDMVADKLRRMDSFVQNSHMEYSRPPVNTTLWGYVSHADGGSKNEHVRSMHALDWKDGNPGTLLYSNGKMKAEFPGIPFAPIKDAFDKGADFLDAVQYAIDIPKNESPSTTLTHPNNESVQLEVVRVHYMINNANDSMVSSETGQNVYGPGDTLWKETTIQNNNTGNRQTKIKVWKQKK